ncbi:ribonuclease HII [Slackia isoflavoniconvertens]|uniref:ribonuclease HII n=1 Tax=Slackia isoflavoniconvertens TaxID=572010 RepID=UPI003AF0D898
MAQTLAEIREALKVTNRVEYEALARALAADERKGVKAALKSAARRLAAEDAEAARLNGMYSFQAKLAGGGIAVGLDEVGRGPVAGPLAIGAVVLPDDPRVEGVNDSKQLSAERREEIAAVVREVAIAWDIEYIQPQEIDEHGMTWALRTANLRAIAAIEEQLSAKDTSLDAVLLDGNAQHLDAREVNIVKGDGKCASIAAASIIAKVDRDALMCRYAEQFPHYGFESNKGYASAEHIEAIKQYGLSPVHRASFCRAWTQEALF